MMTREILEIGGTTPYEEDCAQVGTDGYAEKARKEGRAFINQLRRIFGTEPEGCELRLKSFLHDFGSYYEVVCSFDSENETQVEYAFKCEGDGPANWDKEARQELGMATEEVVLWQCAGCDVQAIRGLDSQLFYRVQGKCAQWYISHPLRDAEPTETPAHVFESGSVCEYCLDDCMICRKPISSLLETGDIYVDSGCLPMTNYSMGGMTPYVCVDCYETQVCSECLSKTDDCNCYKETEDEQSDE